MFRILYAHDVCFDYWDWIGTRMLLVHVPFYNVNVDLIDNMW